MADAKCQKAAEVEDEEAQVQEADAADEESAEKVGSPVRLYISTRGGRKRTVAYRRGRHLRF